MSSFGMIGVAGNTLPVAVAPASRGGSEAVAVRVATELLGRHPGPLHHHCPTCGSFEHGAPSFDAPVAISVAHAAGLSLVAASTAGPVGIDLERLGTADRRWVEEEAIGKARGTGLTDRTQDRDGIELVELDVPGYLAVLAVVSAPPEGEAAPAPPATP